MSATALASTLSITKSSDPALKTAGNVWGGNRAGCALLDMLDARGAVRGRRVLGLGSGMAPLELTAAALGAHVLATDLPVALTILRANGDVNASVVAKGGGTFATAALTWGDDKLPPELAAAGPFSFILASDCIFWPELFAPLVRTFAAVSDAQETPPHVFFTLEPRSPREADFFRELELAGFEYAKIDEIYDSELEKVMSGAAAVFWARSCGLQSGS